MVLAKALAPPDTSSSLMNPPIAIMVKIICMFDGELICTKIRLSIKSRVALKGLYPLSMSEPLKVPRHNDIMILRDHIAMATVRTGGNREINPYSLITSP